MYSCYERTVQPIALYTYYAIVSLVVVVLATSLLWIPFVQLIAELNMIISKVVMQLIYMNKELLGDSNWCGLSQLGAFFNSQQGLKMISLLCSMYLMYLASGDLLVFAGCYIYSLPNVKYLQRIKKFVLNIIEYLLNLRGKIYVAVNTEREFQRSIGAHYHDAM